MYRCCECTVYSLAKIDQPRMKIGRVIMVINGRKRIRQPNDPVFTARTVEVMYK